MDPAFLIALVLAFGFRTDAAAPPMTSVETIGYLYEALVVLGIQATCALITGCILFGAASRTREASRGSRRRFTAVVGRLLGMLSVSAYAYLALFVEWPRVVDRGLGLSATILIDDIVILAPFLLMSVLNWTCLYPAERRILARGGRDSRNLAGLGPYVLRHARQSYGLVLPTILAYCLLHDLAERISPTMMRSSWSPVAGMLLMGVLVLTLAPALVRLTWPTRSLPAGPLRDRLERLARRMEFRCSDILVWETNGTMVNAGVTGALPWFRYVLLTDVLVECFEAREVEAVFGHEVGHVTHRHLAFLGLFFVGSLGILALLGDLVSRLPLHSMLGAMAPQSGSEAWSLVGEAAILIVSLGAYFVVAFGYLSRRFERQADLFGCRAVSCQRVDCPPHLDMNDPRNEANPIPAHVCPVGVRTFANALTSVAAVNGIAPDARSWRHGTIASRIAFLEGLESRPDREQRFQRRVRILCLAVTTGLAVAFVVAACTGALGQL